MISEKIDIRATPELVFQAIRNRRNQSDQEQKRTLRSFDNGIAVIDEQLDNVPVLGKVSCVWEEREQPYDRIDFKMLSSDKFKEAYGAFVLTLKDGGSSTTLELQVHMDPGIRVPFAAEITKMSTSKDSRTRLQAIKKDAEQLAKHKK